MPQQPFRTFAQQRLCLRVLALGPTRWLPTGSGSAHAPSSPAFSDQKSRGPAEAATRHPQTCHPSNRPMPSYMRFARYPHPPAPAAAAALPGSSLNAASACRYLRRNNQSNARLERDERAKELFKPRVRLAAARAFWSTPSASVYLPSHLRATPSLFSTIRVDGCAGPDRFAHQRQRFPVERFAFRILPLVGISRGQIAHEFERVRMLGAQNAPTARQGLELQSRRFGVALLGRCSHLARSISRTSNNWPPVQQEIPTDVGRSRAARGLLPALHPRASRRKRTLEKRGSGGGDPHQRRSVYISILTVLKQIAIHRSV